MELTATEVAKYAADLEVILNHFNKLQQLEVRREASGSHPAPPPSELRDDTVRPSLSLAETMALAPVSDGRFFLVPKVLGD